MSSRTEIPAKVTAGEIKQAFRENLRSGLGRLERFATKNDLYLALALTVRDRLFQCTVESTYLALAEVAIAERVKQAASDLRPNGKRIFAA